MSLVPDSRLGKIQFYEAHIGPWSTNAGEIGLDDESTSSLAALITAARSAYDAAEAARLAAKAATVNFYDKVRACTADPALART
jgi:hypothetical protein